LRFVPAPHVALRNLILLAPQGAEVPDCFLHLEEAQDRHLALLSQMQMLRGAIYLHDGAITHSELLADGRHRQLIDDTSWHVLAMNREGRVCGCARYHETSNRIAFSQLGLANSAMAQCDVWGMKLRAAVDADLHLAAARDVSFVELGGWALAEELRCSIEGLRIALAMYGLAQNLGGGIGVSNATRRYHSSSILRRIGGRPLVTDGLELPAYYDSQYGCEMEILRFDSAAPNPRYEGWIDEIRAHLLTTLVIRSKYPPARRERAIGSIDVSAGEHNGLSQ
jgi:hypothetical protein